MIISRWYKTRNSKDVYEIQVNRTYTYIVGKSNSGKVYLVGYIRSFSLYDEPDIDINPLNGVSIDKIYLFDKCICELVQEFADGAPTWRLVPNFTLEQSPELSPHSENDIGSNYLFFKNP